MKTLACVLLSVHGKNIIYYYFASFASQLKIVADLAMTIMSSGNMKTY